MPETLTDVTAAPSAIVTLEPPLPGTAPRVEPDPAGCGRCLGSGWADPFEVFDGSPPLTWCPDCLGAGLEDCDGCEGYGAVPAPTPCPACDEDLFVDPAA